MTPQVGTAPKHEVGLIFLAAFRWLLLLLFSLILEKAAESVTITFTEDSPAYTLKTLPVIYSPMFGDADQPWHFLWVPNWKYIAGIVQIFLTLLFAAKYFLCLVDPIERFAGIADLTPSKDTQRQVVTRIKEKISNYHIGLIAVVAIPEFVLLFHAATSIASYRQWLMFLFLLVLWDSVAFFFMLEFFTRIEVWWRRLAIRCTKVKRKCTEKLQKLGLATKVVRDVLSILGKKSQDAQEVAARLTQAATQLAEQEEVFNAKLTTKKDELRLLEENRPVFDYGPWNYLDALVLILGLCVDLNYDVLLCCRHFVADWEDVLGIAVVLTLSALLIVTLRAARISTRSRVYILLAMMALVLCIPTHSLLPMQLRNGDAAKAATLTVLLIVSAIFLRSNYRSQQDLWHRHILLLRLG
jgi:hypothetical protein